jgi:hypothetical protein
MTDTLKDIEPPYRSGNSDKTKRMVKWPNVEDSKRRILLSMEGCATTDGVAINVSDLIVLMREMGKLTAENAELKEKLK